MTQQPLWTFNNVSLSGRGRPRLQDVCLQLQPGVTAVIGQSGAGKSSLLNLMVEFETPTSGTVSHCPCLPSSSLPFYWVPQTAGLWPHLNVQQHLDAVAADRSRCDTYLEAFELTSLRWAYPDTLSSGERGRLALARGIAADADVLVMDEPLANVDPGRRRIYWQRIRELCINKSMIFATHSIDTVLSEADQVVCLHNGRIQFAGDKQTLYYKPATSDLADLLGPANWFPQHQDAAHWIQDAKEDHRCYRPEQLQATSRPDSPLQVTSARYTSTVGELEVLDNRTDDQRTFFHRIANRRFKPGDRIAFHALLVLLMAVMISGCTSEDVPQLASSSVNHWSIPSAGKVIPAPRSVRFGPDQEVFVLDNAGRVLVYTATGELLRQWEMPAFDVGKPEGICVLQDGRIAVTDTHYHRVVFFDKNGQVVGMHGERGEEAGQFIYPVAITQDEQENYYICEYGGNDRVQKFSVDGKLILEFGTFGTDPGQFQRPSGIVWHEGKVYVADAINNRIQCFSDEGEFLNLVASDGKLPDLYYPYDLELGLDNTLLTVEYGTGRITRLSQMGAVLGQWGSIGSSKGQLNTPWGLAIGPGGQIVVADTGNRRLVEIKP